MQRAPAGVLLSEHLAPTSPVWAGDDFSLNATLEKMGLEWFPAPRYGNMTVVRASDSVAHVIEVLNKHQILCAPVANPDAPDDCNWNEAYVGVVDSVGLLSFMLHEYRKQHGSDAKSIAALQAKFELVTVGSLLHRKDLRFQPFVALEFAVHNMLDLFMLLGRFALHRVFIVESPATQIRSIITQSRVVEVLNENIAALSPIAHKSLKELGLVKDHPRLAAAFLTHTLQEALQHLVTMNVTAIPVLDDRKKLCGTISVSDGRAVFGNPATLANMQRPLSELFKESLPPFDKLDPRLYSCLPTDTLGYALEKLTTKLPSGHLVHRLWILDEHDHPVGVLALRDVITRVVKDPGASYFHRFGWVSTDKELTHADHQ